MSLKECCSLIGKWSKIPYAGEKTPPTNSVEPDAYSWNTYFLKLGKENKLLDLEIRHPSTIDFANEELWLVKKVLKNLNEKQVYIAEYWNAGPPTKQWTPIIDRLIDTYGISAPRAARILAGVHAAINDAFVATWYYKYMWGIPRPNQLDQELATIVCTPYHPSYPSGHATVAGCVEEVLSYFFPGEKQRLNDLAEECAMSRLFAGVHYKVDNDEGLKLGRQVGRIVVSELMQQYDDDLNHIDKPIIENRHAKMPPPPYKQAIPYPRERKCNSKLDCRQAPEAR